MKKMITSLFVVIMLCSCGMTPMDLLSEKPSLEVNAQIAKNAELDKSVIKVESGKTEQNADEISNDTSYTADTVTQITEHIPPWIIGVLMLFAGWLIPDPKQCVTGMNNALRQIIVEPIKGIANFILLSLGRERL